MTITRFQVVNCRGDQLDVIEVPFTGDLLTDIQAAEADMGKRFKPHKCGQCGDWSPTLDETPLDNAEAYPVEEPYEDDEDCR